MWRFYACPISPTLPILCRWNSTPCWACAYVQTDAGAGRAGPGDSARHQKHYGRPALAAADPGWKPLCKSWRPGGTPVLGVCGGYQMLGKTLDDSTGTESGHPQTLRGLGLLPTADGFHQRKTRAPSPQARSRRTPLQGPELDGYEIHTGRTSIQEQGRRPSARWRTARPRAALQGNVFGTYLHGLFDSGELTERLADLLLPPQGHCHGKRCAHHDAGLPRTAV